MIAVWTACLLGGLLGGVGLVTPLAEREIPAPQGWVTDEANLLDAAQENELTQLIESYRSGTGHEIAVLTIESLEGDSLEGFSLRVARTWKIGQTEMNNGALLVVAAADRKMRIEVGQGLEGELTDSVAGRIIRNVLKPEFQAGRFAEGIREGVIAMHAAIGGDYGPIERRQRKSSGGGLAVLHLLMIIVFMFVAHRGGGRRRGGMGPFLGGYFLGNAFGHRSGGGGGGWGGGGGGGGGFGGFGGGGGFSGGGSSGGW